MQKEFDQSSKDENDVWVLNGKAILAHNRHLQGGFATRPGCKVCSSGVGGMVKTVKGRVPEPVVDEDSRVDQEGDTPPTRSDGWPR